jgi:hypothetical protein
MILPILLAAGLTCGVERADVKHLSDKGARFVKFNPVGRTTVTALAILPDTYAPVQGDEPRGLYLGGLVTPPVEEEFHVYTIDAYVAFAKKEADLDAHIVITDTPPAKVRVKSRGKTTIPKPSMVVESVDARCAPDSIALDMIRGAREAILAATHSTALSTKSLQKLVGKHVRVTGVGFYDKLHGQTGVAPNGIELHPLTGFELIP